MKSGNIFPLKEIIDDLINTDKSLESSLLKLNYFGKLIKNQELIKYTTAELEGYKYEDEIPEYRKAIGTIEATLQAFTNNHVVELPASMLEKPFNEKMRHLEITQGIIVIEQMVNDRNKDDKPDAFFYRPIPMELLHILQPAATKLYKSDVRLTVVKAIIKGNAYKLNEVLTSVRQRLLSFVMEIAEEFGYDIEIASFNKKQSDNNQTINYYMKTEITNTGDGNVVNTGDSSTVTATITITKSDREKLKELGVEELKIVELEKILQVDNHDKPKLKTNLLKWLGEVSAHAAGIGLAHNLPAISEFISKLF